VEGSIVVFPHVPHKYLKFFINSVVHHLVDFWEQICFHNEAHWVHHMHVIQPTKHTSIWCQIDLPNPQPLHFAQLEKDATIGKDPWLLVPANHLIDWYLFAKVAVPWGWSISWCGLYLPLSQNSMDIDPKYRTSNGPYSYCDQKTWCEFGCPFLTVNKHFSVGSFKHLPVHCLPHQRANSSMLLPVASGLLI